MTSVKRGPLGCLHRFTALSIESRLRYASRYGQCAGISWRVSDDDGTSLWPDWPDIDHHSCRTAIADRSTADNAPAQHVQQDAHWQIVLETLGRSSQKMPLICRSFFIEFGRQHPRQFGANRVDRGPTRRFHKAVICGGAPSDFASGALIASIPSGRRNHQVSPFLLSSASPRQQILHRAQGECAFADSSGEACGLEGRHVTPVGSKLQENLSCNLAKLDGSHCANYRCVDASQPQYWYFSPSRCG